MKIRAIAVFSVLIIVSLLCTAQLPVGTARNHLVADGNGNIINTPLSFSNQVSMFVRASNANQIVRYEQFTNSLFNATNSITPIKFGGTGQATTLLSGNWTNSINFTVGGTNNANAYRVKGILGYNGSATNMTGSGTSNILWFCDGIITNITFLP